MSTFGKKALIWWYYDKEDFIRFNHTPKEIQLKILEKWYPIGMPCNINMIEFNIIGYIETNIGWKIKIKSEILSNCIEKIIHPLYLHPYPDYIKMIRRNYKLSRIL